MIDLNKFYKYLEKTLRLLALICSIGLIFIIAWGLNKGFDFSDEGYVLSGFCNPHDICTSNFYQLFFNKLFNWFHPGLLFYRYLRFTAGLFACIYFFYVLSNKKINNQISTSIPNRYWILSIILIGYFISYSIYSSILSYDNIGLIIGILYTATTLRFINEKSVKQGIYHILFFSILFVLQIFSRFPTGILLFPITLIIIGISTFNYKSKIVFVLLFLICSILLPILLISMFYHQDIHTFFIDYRQSISLLENHGILFLLESYKDQLKYVFEHAVSYRKWYIIILFVTSIAARFTNKKVSFQVLLLSIQLIVLMLIFKEIIDLKQFKSGIIFNAIAFEPYMFLMFTFLLVNLVHIHFDYKNPIQNWSILVLFIIYPFICSIGTNNHLPIQLLQYMFFWAIVFYLIYQQNYNHKPVRILNQIFILFFIIIATSQTICGFVYYPYRNTSNLMNNSIYSTNVRLNNILIDQKTSSCIRKFELIINKKSTQKQELQIIDFCKIPGIVYALNGYTPRNAWMQDGLVKYNSYMFHSMNHDFIPDYIFLSNNPNRKSEFQEYFRAVQIPFETDYIFIDSIEHPLFGYEPMPINEYIYIYSKKEHANK